MESAPTELAIVDENLKIVWDDGLEQQLPIQHLRDKCPCATCREKQLENQESQSAFPILSAEKIQITISSMQPAGNYAYTIQFSDGHASGIFTFDLLRSLKP